MFVDDLLYIFDSSFIFIFVQYGYDEIHILNNITFCGYLIDRCKIIYDGV